MDPDARERLRQASGLRSLLAYMWAHPGKQLLFMGQEFGQSAEWSEERGLDWWQLDDQYTGTLHRGVQRLVGDLNSAYRRHPAMWTLDTSPGGYSWIDANDTENNVLSFCVTVLTVRLSPACSTSRAVSTRATASGYQSPADGWKFSTPMPRCTAAPESGTSERSQQRRIRGTVGQPPHRWRCQLLERFG